MFFKKLRRNDKRPHILMVFLKFSILFFSYNVTQNFYIINIESIESQFLKYTFVKIFDFQSFFNLLLETKKVYMYFTNSKNN